MAPVQTNQRNELLTLAFYAAILLITLAASTSTWLTYTLFPLQLGNLGWSNSWLLAYVVDYYGACLCFCGVIVASERTWRTAIPWTMACIIVGSPACCLYLFVWITKEDGTLQLQRNTLTKDELMVVAAASQKTEPCSSHFQCPDLQQDGQPQPSNLEEAISAKRSHLC